MLGAGAVITLQKNSSYHDAANVTMNTIRVISYGDIQKLWKDGQLQYVESEFEGMDRYGKEFVVDSALGTYYANFNVNTQLLP